MLTSELYKLTKSSLKNIPLICLSRENILNSSRIKHSIKSPLLLLAYAEVQQPLPVNCALYYHFYISHPCVSYFF